MSIQSLSWQHNNSNNQSHHYANQGVQNPVLKEEDIVPNFEQARG